MSDNTAALVFDLDSNDMVAFSNLEDAINWMEPIDIRTVKYLILDDQDRAYRPMIDLDEKKLMPIVLSENDRQLLIDIILRFASVVCPGNSVPEGLEAAHKFIATYLLPDL